MFLERGAASRVTLSNARASPLETAGAPTEAFARPTVGAGMAMRSTKK